MNDSHASPARSPSRFSSEPPPSLLLVGGSDDLRRFLRAGVQRWYQVAEACEGAEAVPHLTHCPPCGLIVGQLTGDGEEALRAGLREHAAPPVLKLWVRNEPGAWVDRGLRHPFTHADLLRAVTRLVAGEGGDTVGQEAPRPADVRIEAGARS